MIYLFSMAGDTYMYAGDYFFVDGKIFKKTKKIYLVDYDNIDDIYEANFYLVEECDLVFKIKKRKYLTHELGKYDNIVSYNTRFKAILDREILSIIIDKL